MADKTTQTIYIDAAPDEVMKAIADIESYPQWISEYKEVEVLEALDDVVRSAQRVQRRVAAHSAGFGSGSAKAVSDGH